MQLRIYANVRKIRQWHLKSLTLTQRPLTRSTSGGLLPRGLYYFQNSNAQSLQSVLVLLAQILGPFGQTWVFHKFGWVFHKFTENGEFYIVRILTVRHKNRDACLQKRLACNDWCLIAWLSKALPWAFHCRRGSWNSHWELSSQLVEQQINLQRMVRN